MGQDTSQIRHQIKLTRERLGETMDAIAYKTDIRARLSEKVNERLEDVLLTNLHEIREIATRRGATLRTAAYTLAIDRVVRALKLRGIYA